MVYMNFVGFFYNLQRDNKINKRHVKKRLCVYFISTYERIVVSR